MYSINLKLKSKVLYLSIILGLISLFGTLYNYIIKIINLLYGIPEIKSKYFNIHYLHYNNQVT